MSLLLIDTDIASFIFKGSDYVDPYAPLLSNHELALSFMTVAELFQWAILRQWGDRRFAQLEQSLSNYLVIPTDQPLCCNGQKFVLIENTLDDLFHLKMLGLQQRLYAMTCHSLLKTSKISAKFPTYGSSPLNPNEGDRSTQTSPIGTANLISTKTGQRHIAS